ncbi:MAG: hypothetical protein RLZZ568_1779, partial [Cyanobacteriota bacterium]
MSLPSLNGDRLPNSILILAPQGPEYQAIAKGLRPAQQDPHSRFSLQAIPAGSPALVPFLDNLGHTWQQGTKPEALLVMGVTGSLTPSHSIGQPVWVMECEPWPRKAGTGTFTGDANLSQAIAAMLAKDNNLNAPSVKGISVHQVICQASDKKALAQQSGADVVEMENVAILQFAHNQQLPVAILRVVSDSVMHDLPDLNHIYDAQGRLKAWTLALRFLRHPV